MFKKGTQMHSAVGSLAYAAPVEFFTCYYCEKCYAWLLLEVQFERPTTEESKHY